METVGVKRWFFCLRAVGRRKAAKRPATRTRADKVRGSRAICRIGLSHRTVQQSAKSLPSESTSVTRTQSEAHELQTAMTFREFSLMVKRLSGVNDDGMSMLSLALDKPVPALKKLWDKNGPVSEGTSLAVQRLIETLPQFAALNAIFAKLDSGVVFEEWKGPNPRELIAIITDRAEKPFESLWASSVASLAEAVPFSNDSQDARDYEQVVKGLALVAFFASGRMGHATLQ